jgi:hypothetical protein
MRFRIYWKELLWGHLVAKVGLWNPRIEVDRSQFTAEQHGKTPLRDRGWQDALQSVYPFKINRLAITDGDLTYLDKAAGKPLHITKLDFVSDNIRNIHEPNNVYPSRFSAQMVVFDQGTLSLDGRANYLMKPSPGAVTHYVLTGVPLSAVTPAARHISLTIKRGTLSSEGTVEDSLVLPSKTMASA